MTPDLGALLADLRLAVEGASEDALTTAEEELDCKLPQDVKVLLREHDGGEGTLGPR